MTGAVIRGLLAAALGSYLAGGLAALILWRRPRAASRVAHLAALLGGLGAAAAAVGVLTGTAGATAVNLGLPFRLPFSAATAALGPLSAFFLLVLSLGAILSSIYAPSYVKGYAGRKSLAWLSALHDFFLLSMSLVVTASDAVGFLVAWEAMSVFSYLLVVTDHEDPAVRRAGFVYVVMTHAGTAFLMVAFLLLATASGRTGFAGFQAAAAHLSPGLRSLIFLCLVVGFGTKAGVIPLHIWLPRAHPAAPSHVSGLMSGVMVKTAVYGLLLFAVEILGTGPAWWGALLAALGLACAILGVLYATMESDLKRLLAFSTIENIGVILTGLGMALFAGSLGYGRLAAALLTAALLHTLNHALFKTLLFQAVGAVHRATHTRNMEELGGLIKRMPQTAALFLGGALAISALPPLNGFVSEWLALKGLVDLAGAPGLPGGRAAALLAASGLALTGALVAACLVKAFGIAFLGLPRSGRVEAAHEAPLGMRAAMFIALGLCLLIGLWPGPAQTLAARAAAGLLAAAPAAPEGPAPIAGGSPATGALAVTILLATGAAVALARLLSKGRPTRVAEPWACGVELEPVMEYSGAALVKPLRIFFRTLLRPQREVSREDAGQPYFPQVIRYEGTLRPVYERLLYAPARRALLVTSGWARRIQTGSVQVYLAYILVTLALLLVLAR